jgi:hypothetical protein
MSRVSNVHTSNDRVPHFLLPPLHWPLDIVCQIVPSGSAAVCTDSAVSDTVAANSLTNLKLGSRSSDGAKPFKAIARKGQGEDGAIAVYLSARSMRSRSSAVKTVKTTGCGLMVIQKCFEGLVNFVLLA